MLLLIFFKKPKNIILCQKIQNSLKYSIRYSIVKLEDTKLVWKKHIKIILQTYLPNVIIIVIQVIFKMFINHKIKW